LNATDATASTTDYSTANAILNATDNTTANSIGNVIVSPDDYTPVGAAINTISNLTDNDTRNGTHHGMHNGTHNDTHNDTANNFVTTDWGMLPHCRGQEQNMHGKYLDSHKATIDAVNVLLQPVLSTTPTTLSSVMPKAKIVPAGGWHSTTPGSFIIAVPWPATTGENTLWRSFVACVKSGKIYATQVSYVHYDGAFSSSFGSCQEGLATCVGVQ